MKRICSKCGEPFDPYISKKGRLKGSISRICLGCNGKSSISEERIKEAIKEMVYSNREFFEKALKEKYGICEYLIDNDIEPRIARCVEWKLKRIAKEILYPIRIDHDFAGMRQIFRPIGGQDKGDVFNEQNGNENKNES